MRLLIALILLCIGVQANAARCDFRAYGHGEPAEFAKFLKKFKKVKSASQLARYASYPIKLNTKPKKIISNRTQFVKNAKVIWSDKVKRAIEKSNFHFVHCDNGGIMIGKGNIWLKYNKKTYKIIAINP